MWEISMRLTLLLVSVSAALGACTTPAGEAPTAPHAPIVGGYSQANLSDEGVKAARAVAEKEIYTRNPTRALVDKVSAETQVVAGMNYRFTIVMSGGASYRVVVYRPLQGDMTVSDYEKLS